MSEHTHKKTMVLGASANPDRYSNICINDLVLYHYPVVAIGLREGEVAGVTIQKGFPVVDDVHTVTMYIGPQNQEQYIHYILEVIKPRRIIFNPGTWNQEFADKARELEIKVESKCTLLMLGGGYY
ncbi:MAG: CoA-binding protein [Bacteroidales bacterium]|nr:CoA-binding protein [Bacteroidales bacterium]MBK9357218.1 CoA-binding protein [Bacteroidales bacterium]